MPTLPTVGVFLPGKLNAVNTPSFLGAQDAYGTNYPTGLVSGKAIELSFKEAQDLQAGPPSIEQLYEGAYQFVQVDSGAVAAEVNTGLAAFYKLPNPAAPVAGIGTVTSESSVSPVASKSLFAGVFLNPIPPGNYGFIFVGAGRVNVTFKTTLGTAGQQGNTAVVGGGAGTFDGGSATAILATTVGLQTVAASGGGTSPIYIRELLYRIAG